MKKSEQQRRGRKTTAILYTIIFAIAVSPSIASAETKQDANGCRGSKGSAQNSQSLTQAHQVFKVHSMGEDEALPPSSMENLDHLQQIINTQWSRMIAAFTQGDVEEALQFIATRNREIVRQDWATLHGSFDGLVQTFGGPLHVTDFHKSQLTAQAVLPPVQVSLQCPLTVTFVLDSDGQWRVGHF